MTILPGISQFDRKNDAGPFDIIGDVHGCYDELITLLKTLGYKLENSDPLKLSHPGGRRLLFVGDLVDRGPNSPGVLRLVMSAVAAGMAVCVSGNHDDKLRRKLMGNDVKLQHGLAETIEQLDSESEDFRDSVLEFINQLPYYCMFDDGKLVVCHAGINEHDLGKVSPRIRALCLYGKTTGAVDDSGFPIRYPWADEYKGQSLIVYGHTVVLQPQWVNNTINIDTGCVFGGEADRS